MDTYEFWDELGNIFDAVSAYQRKSVEFNRNFINPWIRLGPLFDRNNRDQDTIMAYQKAIELDSTNADIWLELGEAYFKVGEYENAADAYQKAIELDDSSGWSYSNLAHAYLYQGKYSEAVDLYLKSIETFNNDKDKAISWNRLGNLYRTLHEYEKALLAFQQADLLDSNVSGTQDDLRQCEINPPNPAGCAVTAGQSDEEFGLEAPQNKPETSLNQDLPEIKEIPTSEPDLADLANKTTSVWDADSAGSKIRNPLTVTGETSDAFPENERTQVVAVYEEILQPRDFASNQRLSQISNNPSPNDELTASDIATVPIDCVATTETPEEVFEKQVERKTSELGSDNAIHEKANDIQEKTLSFDNGKTWLESDPEKTSEEELPLSIDNADSPLAFQDSLPGINVETKRCKDANKIEESKTALPSFFDDLDGSFSSVTPFTAGVMNQPVCKEDEDIIGPSVWDEFDSTGKNESSLTHEETGGQVDLVCSTNFEENDNCLSGHATGEDTIIESMEKEPSVQSDDLIPTNTQVDTDNAHLWNELGNVYFNKGAFSDATIAYGKAIELDPWFAWPYSNLGLVYFREGKLDDAIYMYQQGIGLFTDEKGKAMTWNRLGDAYRRLNDYDNAIAAYQKADELAPNTNSFSFESSLLGGQNKYQKSVECPTTGGYYEPA